MACDNRTMSEREDLATEPWHKSESPTRPLLGERVAAPEHGLSFRFQEAGDLTEDDEAAIVTLLRTAFNGGPSWFALVEDPLDHLHWKFRDFPGTAQAELVEEGNRLVGMIYALRRRFLVQGRELVARDGVDLAIDPSMQGRGVQTLRVDTMLPVRKQMFPEVAFSWNLMAHPATRHLRERLGNQLVANRLERHLRLISGRKLLTRSRRPGQAEGASRTRAVLKSRGRSVRPMIERALQAVRIAAARARAARKRAPAHVELSTLSEFDKQFDEFGAAAGAAFDFIQTRDAEYLNWRFCDPRGGDFVVRAAADGGRWLGYAAIRIDDREAILADLLALPGRLDVIRALVADAIDVADARGAPILRAWLPRSHPYRSALREFGFVSTPETVTLAYQMWNGEADEMKILDDPSASIHFMVADSDHV